MPGEAGGAMPAKAVKLDSFPWQDRQATPVEPQVQAKGGILLAHEWWGIARWYR